MLKYSFMTFACPEYTLDQALAAALRYGYDGIEPRAAEGHKHGVELERSLIERAAIRRNFEDAGIAAACVATSVQFNKSDRAEWTGMVQSAKDYCRLAADIGAKRVRVFGGHDPATPDVAKASRRVQEGLEACVETAADSGVLLCLETHDYFSAAADVAAICRAVNSPWIQATWDTQHPVTAGETIEESVAVLMPFVRHVHFHDVDRTHDRNQIVPIGEGQEPIAKFLRIFRDHNFDGYLSAEWFYNNGPEQDLAHYIAALRSIEETL